MARYAFMIIASDNHAYRTLTPFAPVIRGHKCLSCPLSTTTGFVGSAPPFGRSLPNKPLPRPPPLKAVRSFFCRLALPSESFHPRTLPIITHRPLLFKMSHSESAADKPLRTRLPTPHPLKGDTSELATAPLRC